MSAALAQAQLPPQRSTVYPTSFTGNIQHAAAVYATNSALTLEAWVYREDASRCETIVSQGFTQSFWFGFCTGSLRFYRSGGLYADAGTNVPAHRWTHVAAAYGLLKGGGGEVRFYIDGSLVATRSLDSAGGGQNLPVVVGGDPGSSGYHFRGALDEVRIWSAARTADEILTNRFRELVGEAGLTAVFPTGGAFEAVSGNTVASPAGVLTQVAGMLPRDLVVPFTPLNISVDGSPSDLEYGGSEELMVRYLDGGQEVDTVARLIRSRPDGSSNTNLYIALTFPVLQNGNFDPSDGSVRMGFDPDGSGDSLPGSDDLQLLYSAFTSSPARAAGRGLNGLGGFGYQTGLEDTLGFVAAETFCVSEFAPPCVEMGIPIPSVVTPGTNEIGFMLDLYRAASGGTSGILLPAPFDALSGNPATWARLRLGGSVSVPTGSINLSGTVGNTATGAGVSGLNVWLYSGNSQNTGLLLASRVTGASGAFNFNGVNVPAGQQVVVAYERPSGIALELLDPTFDSFSGYTAPETVLNPVEVRYPPCSSFCNYQPVHFRFRQIGPLRLDSVAGSPAMAPVVVRTSPYKQSPGGQLTLFGSNFNNSIIVYLKGSGCNLIPPSLCTSDFIPATIDSLSPEGSTVTVNVPPVPGAEHSPRNMQVVVENPMWLSTGGNQWTYGPTVTVTPPTYPFLYGFEFRNEDDGPSYAEFEACYGSSIFNPFPPFRDPYYALYFAVYEGWMAAAVGSCSGFASLSRLMEEGTVPIGSFDTTRGDGVHGVIFPDGYLGLDPCDEGDSRRCAPKPSHWTGFDLFQPYRPLNVWARIVSFQGVQSSAEFLNEFLSQLGRPIASGPRRGFAVGDPVAALNRIRSNPSEYMLSIFERDLGGAHSLTPYAVVDGQKLEDDLVTPTPSSGFSLIKVYDSNHPEQESFLEVDTVQDTFRYLIGVDTDGTNIVFDGAGMFSFPLSLFRGDRHAPNPFNSGVWGIDLTRFLIIGATTASHQDAAGGVIGWPDGSFTNSYEGALAFLPPADAIHDTNRNDAMLFLPVTNPPVSATFQSAGSNVLVYAAVGWGDIAINFETTNTVAIHELDSFGTGPDGLKSLGLRTTAPVRGFNVAIASRDSNGPCRIFLLDAGSAAIKPDLVVERAGLTSLKIRNRSPEPFSFRLGLSGTDPNVGRFDRAFGTYNQPPNSTLTLRLPAVLPAVQVGTYVVRELDTDNDGLPELTENLPANGALRAALENQQVVLRWRRAAMDEVLESASNLTEAAWAPTQLNISDNGPDRTVVVGPGTPAQFFRLRQPATHCLLLSAIVPGLLPNPWETNGYEFEALDGAMTPLPQNLVATQNGFTGLEVLNTMTVHPLGDCQAVTLEVYQPANVVTFEAIGPLGMVMDRADLVGMDKTSQSVTLSAPWGSIWYVRITAAKVPGLLLNVCCERNGQPQLGSTVSHCQSFSDIQAGSYNTPFESGELSVSAYDANDQALPAVQIGSDAAGPGNWLHVEPRTVIELLYPLSSCPQVKLTLVTLEAGTSVQAYDADGNLVGSSGPIAAAPGPQTVVVSGSEITRLEILTSSSKTQLQDVCCERIVGPQ